MKVNIENQHKRLERSDLWFDHLALGTQFVNCVRASNSPQDTFCVWTVRFNKYLVYVVGYTLQTLKQKKKLIDHKDCLNLKQDLNDME